VRSVRLGSAHGIVTAASTPRRPPWNPHVDVPADDWSSPARSCWSWRCRPWLWRRTSSTSGANDVHAPGIHYLSDTGITLGCATNPDRFCPNDGLTRAQMGSFLFRASGHDPDTPPSVNAAELDGQGPSAYTTTVSSTQRTTETAPLGGVIVTVLAIEDLPAGQYVISGNVLATSQPGTTESMVMCSVHVGTAMAGRSLTRIGTDQGHVLEATLPLAGQATIANGTADLEVRCNAPLLTGDGPVVGGGEHARHPGDRHARRRCGRQLRVTPSRFAREP
jgi:hypothetical protein